MNKFYKETRYNVQAKRRDTDEPYTDWTKTNSYEVAVEQAKRIEELGYLSKIIDREATNEV